MSRKAIVLATAAVVGLAIVVTYMIWSASEKLPDPPPGVRCYTDIVFVSVTPREGEQWARPGYQATQFVMMTSGEIGAPILRVVRPNFRGVMGSVRHDPVWETTYHALGEGQAHLIMPVGEEIAKYIVLVRRIRTREEPDEDPWRVWIIEPHELRGMLTMPRFESMERLSQRKDADALLDKQHMAETFAKSLR